MISSCEWQLAYAALAAGCSLNSYDRFSSVRLRCFCVLFTRHGIDYIALRSFLCALAASRPCVRNGTSKLDVFARFGVGVRIGRLSLKNLRRGKSHAVRFSFYGNTAWDRLTLSARNGYGRLMSGTNSHERQIPFLRFLRIFAATPFANSISSRARNATLTRTSFHGLSHR
jgi:hypothetical protein